MHELPGDKLGWYQIGEKWNLFINGNLEEVFITYIQVTELPTTDGYRVTHYGRDGRLITRLTLDGSDMCPVLENQETVLKPAHI